MIKTKIDCDWSDSIGLLGYKDCCKNIMATPPLQWFFLAALVLIFGFSFRTCRISSEINRYNIFCDFPCSVRQWRQKALPHSGAIRRFKESTKKGLHTPYTGWCTPPIQHPPCTATGSQASRPRTEPFPIQAVAPPF